MNRIYPTWFQIPFRHHWRIKNNWVPSASNVQRICLYHLALYSLVRFVFSSLHVHVPVFAANEFIAVCSIPCMCVASIRFCMCIHVSTVRLYAGWIRIQFRFEDRIRVGFGFRGLWIRLSFSGKSLRMTVVNH